MSSSFAVHELPVVLCMMRDLDIIAFRTCWYAVRCLVCTNTVLCAV